MKKQFPQQETELNKCALSNEKELEPSSLEQLKESSSYSQVNLYTYNQFDKNKLKRNNQKILLIQKRIKEIQQNPTSGSFVLHEGLLYKLMPMSLRNVTKIK